MVMDRKEKVEGALEGLALIVEYFSKHVDEGSALHQIIEDDRRLCVNPVWEPLRYNDSSRENGFGLGWSYALDHVREALAVVRDLPWDADGIADEQ